MIFWMISESFRISISAYHIRLAEWQYLDKVLVIGRCQSLVHGVIGEVAGVGDIPDVGVPVIIVLGVVDCSLEVFLIGSGGPHAALTDGTW